MFQTLALVPCFVCTLCQHRAGWQSRVIAFITSHPSSSRIDQPAADLLCNGGSIKTDSSVTWHPPISHVKHRYSPSAAAAGWKKKKKMQPECGIPVADFCDPPSVKTAFISISTIWLSLDRRIRPTHTVGRGHQPCKSRDASSVSGRTSQKKKKKSVSSFRPHK